MSESRLALLEALLEAQPKCGDCDEIATRTCHGDLFYCDNPEHGWEGLPDMDTADLIRKLTANSKESPK